MTDWMQSWVDKVCEVMSVADRHGKPVTSFRVFTPNELPNAITPEMAPCAVSYVTDVQVEYSTGGPTLLFFTGQTEFHLTTDVKPANVEYCMSMFEPIVRACAANMKLTNTVEHFMVAQGAGNSLQFITYRNPDGRDDHQGVVVRWIVKQNISGDLTVSA